MTQVKGVMYLIFCPRGCQKHEKEIVNEAVLWRWLNSTCTYCAQCALDAIVK